MKSNAKLIGERRAAGIPLWVHLSAMVLVALLPLVLLSSYLSYERASATRIEIDRQVQALSDNISTRLDRHLESAVAALQALATGVDTGNLKELDARARLLLPDRGTVISLRDRTGQQLVNTAVPYGSPLPVTASGVVRAADKAVHQSGDVFFSNAYIGTVSPQWFFLINVPVFMRSEVEYTLNIAMTPNDIGGRLFFDLPSGWLSAVVDQNGRVIARSRDIERFAGTLATSDLREAISSTPRGMMKTVTLDGVEVLSSFTRSPLSGYTVVASLPQSELHRPLERLKNELWAFAAIAALSSLTAAAAYGYVLIAGLSRIGRATLSATQNEVAKPAYSTVSEFNTLTDILWSSSQALVKRNGDLRILLAELNHRVKNTLAVLQAVLVGTVRSGGGDKRLVASIQGRIAAVSTAHDLLTDAEWRDVDLKKVIEASTSISGCELEIDAGPEVLITSKAVIAISQALYEISEHIMGGHTLRISWSSDNSQVSLLMIMDARQAIRPFDSFANKIVRLCIERQLDGKVDERLGDKPPTITLRFPTVQFHNYRKDS